MPLQRAYVVMHPSIWWIPLRGRLEHLGTLAPSPDAALGD
jgi:hypothetical protein